MVGQDRLPDAVHAVLGQQRVGGLHRHGLDVQPDHMPFRPGQAAQKQRVVAVAAGGVHVQPAGLYRAGQQLLGQPHGGQVGHVQAAQRVALAHKAEPPVPAPRRRCFPARAAGR